MKPVLKEFGTRSAVSLNRRCWSIGFVNLGFDSIVRDDAMTESGCLAGIGSMTGIGGGRIAGDVMVLPKYVFDFMFTANGFVCRLSGGGISRPSISEMNGREGVDAMLSQVAIPGPLGLAGALTVT